MKLLLNEVACRVACFPTAAGEHAPGWVSIPTPPNGDGMAPGASVRSNASNSSVEFNT